MLAATVSQRTRSLWRRKTDVRRWCFILCAYVIIYIFYVYSIYMFCIQCNYSIFYACILRNFLVGGLEQRAALRQRQWVDACPAREDALRGNLLCVTSMATTTNVPSTSTTVPSTTLTFSVCMFMYLYVLLCICVCHSES